MSSTTPLPETPAPPAPQEIDAILHQLDELEGLMQRMLAIPAPPELQTDVREPDAQPAAAILERLHERWSLDAKPRELPNQVKNPIRETNDSFRTIATDDPPPKRRRRSHFGMRGWSRWTYTAMVLRPLVLTNIAFDFTAGMFGPSGRWLRSGTGRACLGGLGLLLLALALGWWLIAWISWSW